jgi:MarR family transcriptional regulator for hemolysin
MKSFEYLQIYARILASYNQTVTKTCQEYGLNHTCFDILIFLNNNPQYDTAWQIEEKRGIKKAMTSVAVEQLSRAGYLERVADTADRRIQHLKLTAKSHEITEIRSRMQDTFHQQLCADLTPQELDCYEKINEKLLHSLQSSNTERRQTS